MRASEFVQTYARQGLAKWEEAALAMIAHGEIAQPPFLDVPVSMPPTPASPGRAASPGHEGVFHAAGDYLAIGEPGDYMRMPLTPRRAQQAADQFSVLLPTSKMVDAIWRAAPLKLAVDGQAPNRGADLAQYLAHSRKVDAALATTGALDAAGVPTRPAAGGMKDIVVATMVPGYAGPRPIRPGKVIIYGWHGPDGRRVQGKSDVHGDFYVDYSHGARLVAPNMTVDGRDMLVADVLQHPVLWQLLSDEGPIAPSAKRRAAGLTTPGYDPLPVAKGPLFASFAALAPFDGGRYARGLDLWTDQLFGRRLA